MCVIGLAASLLVASCGGSSSKSGTSLSGGGAGGGSGTANPAAIESFTVSNLSVKTGESTQLAVRGSATVPVTAQRKWEKISGPNVVFTDTGTDTLQIGPQASSVKGLAVFRHTITDGGTTIDTQDVEVSFIGDEPADPYELVVSLTDEVDVTQSDTIKVILRLKSGATIDPLRIVKVVATVVMKDPTRVPNKAIEISVSKQGQTGTGNPFAENTVGLPADTQFKPIEFNDVSSLKLTISDSGSNFVNTVHQTDLLQALPTSPGVAVSETIGLPAPVK